MRLKRSVEEYEANSGWSSHYFAENAANLMRQLMSRGVSVSVGRTVVHMSKNGLKLKAYVHHNGRTEEFATITKNNGEELLTVHYTDFHKITNFLFQEFKLEE